MIFLVPNQTYAAFLAFQQHQLNLFRSMMQQTQQAQMGTLQSQVQLPQQQQISDIVSRSNLSSISAGPVFSTVNIAPSTSQTSFSIYLATPQQTTVHTPVTTIQCDSYSQQQKLLYNNSASGASSSQVATYD